MSLALNFLSIYKSKKKMRMRLQKRINCFEKMSLKISIFMNDKFLEKKLKYFK